MKSRLHRLASTCQHDAIFSLAYLRVTENVQAAQKQGYFSDRKWLNRLDAVFAGLYFDVMDDWHSGDRKDVPRAWRIALQAEDDKSMTGLGNFMLAMNAHINRDFPHVLAEGRADRQERHEPQVRPQPLQQAARLPLRPGVQGGGAALRPEVRRHRHRPARGDRRRRDHARLARGRVAARRGPGPEPQPGPAPAGRQEIELYAATQAVLIKTLLGAGNSRKRDAWCADHGLDDSSSLPTRERRPRRRGPRTPRPARGRRRGR